MQETTWTSADQRGFLSLLNDYYQLTKPRLILLFLITTAASMELASQGEVNPWLFLVTLVSGALAAGSANTINCLYDRDIDGIMERTRHRPLPSGRVQPWEALVFAIALAMTSFLLLTIFANLLSGLLAMAGIAVYVGVYTHWLKRSSSKNIVIGGAAGAIPPLVGWAAVTGELAWPAWVLFAIIFIWTPPHFWPLAMLIQDDYARVNVPMLPVVDGDGVTAKQIFIYTLALVPTTLLLVYPFGVSGFLYGAIALVLGGMFIYRAWELMQAPSDKDEARSLFKFSILYMMLLCAAMAIDSLPFTQECLTSLTTAIAAMGTR
ncbi:heme o synthase [Candidatus Synechococcus calcipolaris G9]|uniref:Protoheme IX farnesyltransferase n=1 Tax=Candidatus Synechococcus calcipolaris G9 TaxID=1497997 RepID=A0ABT6EZK8_9SYNE|nr:heme o synthase [Candidatus Synechococcus calcipolaris]MDG2991010.1 heme o synthase [Candidatus Synechococcus calcipolaris G9]